MRRPSRIMLWLAMAVLLAALTWFFDFLGAGGSSQQLRVTGSEVRIFADRQGHYRAEGEINGRAVEFLLDTGATSVAVPAKLAEQLGLQRGPEIQLQTANGVSRGYLTRIERVKLGSIQVNNVSAVITAGLDGEVLLGMSFLSHLNWRRSQDELLLAPSIEDE